MIQVLHDTICIAIHSSRYDTYLNTLKLSATAERLLIHTVIPRLCRRGIQLITSTIHIMLSKYILILTALAFLGRVSDFLSPELKHSPHIILGLHMLHSNTNV
jgi:hypothetical protein